MFQKVLEYAGEYRKTTYLSMVVMLIGIVMNVLPFLFIYQLIRPLLLGESLELGYAAWRVAAIRLRGPIRCPICKGPVPLPPGGLQHPEKPAGFPPGKAGAAAPGRDPGEGRGRLEEDVH